MRPAIRDMARHALAANDVRFPDRWTMRYSRNKLRAALNRFGDRGLVVSVGAGKATKRTPVI